MPIPQTPSSVDPGPAGTFKWKGLNWRAQSYLKAIPANIILNTDGTITCKQTAAGGMEMESTRGGLGYGDYYIVTDTDLAKLPKKVVWGGHFPYDGTDAKQEFDCQEASTWGGSAVTFSPHHWRDNAAGEVNGIRTGGNAPASAGNPFPVPAGGPWCNVTKWRKGRVDYEIYRALDASDPSKLYWKGYSTTGIPVPKNTTTQHINLWTNPRDTPVPSTVHLVDFSFIPENAVVDPPVTPPVTEDKAPGTATNVRAEAVTANQATLAWNPGVGTVTGYEVSVRGDGWNSNQPWSTSLPSSARSFSFGNLTSGTTFVLGVTPVNGNAKGPASSVTAKPGQTVPPIDPPKPDPETGLPAPLPLTAGTTKIAQSFNELLTYLESKGL